MLALDQVQQYFEPLGLLVGRHIDGGRVELARAHRPGWCGALGLEAGNQCDLLETFPFLQVFWEDALAWWAAGEGRLLRSGIWNEVQGSVSLQLEAAALVLTGEALVLVGPYYLELNHLQELLQTARQCHLDHEALEKAQRSLAAASAKISAILAAIPDLYVFFDQAGRVGAHNMGSVQEVQVPLAVLVGESAAQQILVAAKGLNANEGLLRFEFEREVGVSVRLFEARLQIMEASTYLCLIRDISEARELDRRKAEFLAMAGHELRTPLTAIKGSLKMFLLRFASLLPEAATQMLGMTLRNGDRLLTLVNDLLDLQRVELGARTLVLEPLPADLLVARVVEDNQPFAVELGVGLVADADSGLTVLADSSAMIQVLTNLVSNAVKFSPKGAEVRIGARSCGSLVAFYVVDCGPGIPASHQDRVFEKFLQIPRADKVTVKGTGLGLSICKAIVAEHGGNISFKTSPSGSTFFVHLSKQKW